MTAALPTFVDAADTGRLDSARIVDVWDLGSGVDPVRRAAAALTLALPELPWSETMKVSLGERDRLLLGLLGADTTSTIEGVFDCPACGQPIELNVSCAQLLATEAPGPAEPVEIDGWHIGWRLPNSDDLLAASGLDPDTDAAAFLFARCVLDISGPAGPAALSDLPSAVRTALEEHIDAWDPLNDVNLDGGCPNCDAPHSVDLDIVTLAWNEIDTRARELLREVHTLARSYGWTEPEVLALSPRRRRAYLRLADG